MTTKPDTPVYDADFLNYDPHDRLEKEIDSDVLMILTRSQGDDVYYGQDFYREVYFSTFDDFDIRVAWRVSERECDDNCIPLVLLGKVTDDDEQEVGWIAKWDRKAVTYDNGRAVVGYTVTQREL